MTKLVFSTTLKEATWKNSRLQRETSIRAPSPTMKRQPGKDMIIFGSGSIVTQLTRHGLIDEYQLVVNPVLLGSGQPLLAGLSHTASAGAAGGQAISLGQRYPALRAGRMTLELDEHFFRREAGRMVPALTRIFGVHNLALAEDVVQDAFCARWTCGRRPACPKIRRRG